MNLLTDTPAAYNVNLACIKADVIQTDRFYAYC